MANNNLNQNRQFLEHRLLQRLDTHLKRYEKHKDYEIRIKSWSVALTTAAAVFSVREITCHSYTQNFIYLCIPWFGLFIFWFLNAYINFDFQRSSKESGSHFKIIGDYLIMGDLLSAQKALNNNPKRLSKGKYNPLRFFGEKIPGIFKEMFILGNAVFYSSVMVLWLFIWHFIVSERVLPKGFEIGTIVILVSTLILSAILICVNHPKWKRKVEQFEKEQRKLVEDSIYSFNKEKKKNSKKG